MGRELRRVPLNFSWPLNKVWEGYLNPHHRKCPDCEDGYTAAGRCFQRIVHLLMIAGEDGARGTLHPWLAEAGVDRPPSREMADLTVGLAGRSMTIGHDSLDGWSAEKKIKKAAGVPANWGVCKSCKGDAIDPAVRKEYKRWRSKEPPKGPGFQLWETTSEGSPQSPVFKTLDELATWCAANATTFGSSRATADAWKRMLAEDNVHHQEGNLVFV